MSTEAIATPSSSHTDNDLNTFTVSGKAVIDWVTPGAEHHHLVDPDPKSRHILFEVCLENDTSQRLCFFRLRIPVRHKHLHDITLYIHIPPDHISSLDWAVQHEAADYVRSKLCTDITRVRFGLHKPVQLIVPDQKSLPPKRPLTASIIEALNSLATAFTVSIYLEHTTLSKARLHSVAEVVHSGQSRPIPRYGDLHRLYEGIGGKIILPVNDNNPSTKSEAAPSVEVDSPPSYDEIGPGPPMPPLAAGSKRTHGKRHRQFSGASSDNGNPPSARPSKRGILDRDARNAETAAGEGNGVEALVQKLFDELAQMKEVVVKQGEIIETLKSEVIKLQDQSMSQQEEVAILEQRMDMSDVAVVDLDATVIQQGESLAELEDSTAALQEYCDDFPSRRAPELEEIRDELRAEVMSRLRNALESP